jgi:hypothetical protein
MNFFLAQEDFRSRPSSSPQRLEFGIWNLACGSTALGSEGGEFAKDDP